MKIGFVLDDTLDKSDGVQQYVITLGEWLRSQGHDVHYLVTNSVNSGVENVHSLGKFISLRFNKNNVRTPLPISKKRIATFLSTERFDVLHVQLPCSPVFATRIVKFAPQTTTIVGTFHIVPVARWHYPLNKLLRLGIKPALRRMSAIISVSTAAQQFAKSAYRIDSVVIPNMVDVKRFATNQAKSSSDTLQITFLGRLVERKGCEYLIDAVPLLIKQGLSNFAVTIAGTGPDLHKLQHRVSELGISKYVSFAGYISEADKPALLSQTDIAVFPAIGGESFGIVLIEAMASGSGVVLGADNIGYNSVLRTIPESLFDIKSSQAIGQKIMQFSNSQNRQQIHEEQQRHVMIYDVNVVGARIEQLYKSELAKQKTQVG